MRSRGAPEPRMTDIISIDSGSITTSSGSVNATVLYLIVESARSSVSHAFAPFRCWDFGTSMSYGPVTFSSMRSTLPVATSIQRRPVVRVGTLIETHESFHLISGGGEPAGA